MPYLPFLDWVLLENGAEFRKKRSSTNKALHLRSKSKESCKKSDLQNDVTFHLHYSLLFFYHN